MIDGKKIQPVISARIATSSTTKAITWQHTRHLIFFMIFLPRTFSLRRCVSYGRTCAEGLQESVSTRAGETAPTATGTASCGSWNLCGAPVRTQGRDPGWRERARSMIDALRDAGCEAPAHAVRERRFQPPGCLPVEIARSEGMRHQTTEPFRMIPYRPPSADRLAVHTDGIEATRSA